MFLVDSHCHLDMLIKDQKLADIVQRAEEANVKFIQTICVKLSSLPKLIEIIDNFSKLVASVGVHPCNVATGKLSIINNISLNRLANPTIAGQIDNSLVLAQGLVTLAHHSKIIGFGETGLDYYREDIENSSNQILSFVEHIKAAHQANLPLIIHTRSAEQDTFEILKSEMQNNHFTGLIHCFTASEDFARKVLDLGLYISFSGIITFKNAQELRDIIKFVPLDRIIIETDSPYLAPVPMRGKINEPSFVQHIATEIARIKTVNYDKICEITSNNFFNLFTKAKFLLEQ